MLIQYPKCPKCKTEKDVVFRIADVKEDKVWFHIAYCKKCWTVIECNFQGRLATEEEKKEMKKEAKAIILDGNPLSLACYCEEYPDMAKELFKEGVEG